MKFRKKRSILIKRKHLQIVVPIIVVLIAFFAISSIVSSNKEQNELKQAVDQLSDVGVINVGLRGDLGALCSFSTETGEFEGLEKDVVDEIIRRLYGDEILVNYIEVNSETKDALIRIGELDMALGASLEKKISGVSHTASYYSDGSAFLVIEGEMTDQSGLNGRSVAIVQGSLATQDSDEEELNRMEAYLAAHDINAEVMIYASYPEAIDALAQGHVGAVCANEINLKHHGKMGMLILQERFMPHRFCVEIASSLGMLNDIVSNTIAEMREDGTLAQLYDKWKLVNYQSLEE